MNFRLCSKIAGAYLGDYSGTLCAAVAHAREYLTCSHECVVIWCGNTRVAEICLDRQWIKEDWRVTIANATR